MIYLYFNYHQSKSTWLILTFLYPLHCYWFYGFLKQQIHTRNQQRKRSQYNKIVYNNKELEMVLNSIWTQTTQTRLYIMEEEDDDDYFMKDKRHY